MSAKPATCVRTDGFEAYTVRNNGEWASIVLRQFEALGVDKQPRHIGEILIYSSYGSWGYQWGHLGQPFKQWLLTAERDYIAGKFMGSKAYEFDGEKSVLGLRQSLLEHRRAGDLTKDDARSIWDWIDANESELESGDREFVDALYRCSSEADWKHKPSGERYAECRPQDGARHFLDEPYERPRTSLSSEFANFWQRVWPVFIDHLKAEAK